MDKSTLIDRLNDDLAGELMAVIQYLQYSAMITGMDRPQLQAFFRAEIPDELGHAQFLSEKIAALGGVPTTKPKPVPEAKGAEQMLMAILKAEKEAIAGYTQRVKDADEFGDIGLKVQLEDQIRDETTHKEAVEMLLGK